MRIYLVSFILTLLFPYGSFDGVCSGETKPNVITNVTVNTSRGTVVGTHMDLGNDKNQMYYGSGDVFLGIPYVIPPTGEYRWKKPARLDKFTTSPWDATYYRSACPQLKVDEISEDCLYLNIFTPDVSLQKSSRLHSCSEFR